jgi:hypothetical protein
MAIVVDPDNLDRDQVILGTETQRLSLYPVGARTSTVASSNTATVSAGSDTLHDTSGLFTTTFDVTAGNVVVMRNKSGASHYIVSAVTDANTLELTSPDGAFTFSADASAITYAIHIASGGSIADGVAKQALYSFAKEEWRTDTYATALVDDLIRHEFPFEAITSEQFEIGGGAAHADWDYSNNYTRKKIRTGGWALKDGAAASTKEEYTGIVTLGTLDADAQVYYQQSSAQANPTDFTFQGAVNEPILILSSSLVDYTAYLKLFVRKKARTYAQSEIADIGVTQIKTIVNRFPLTHAVDAAITASDANILGGSPWRDVTSTVTDTTGVTSATTATVGKFRCATGSLFTASAVVTGDTLFITGTQTDAGYYSITSVINASTLQVDTTENGAFTGASTLDYDIFTPLRWADKAGNVATEFQVQTSAGVSAAVAVASVTGGQFVTRNAAVGDTLVITSSPSSLEGAYTVVSVISETTLQVDATDNPFGVTSGNDAFLYHGGMFLQYKKENVSLAATGNVTFASTTNSATRASGSWSADGVTAGTVLTFASTVLNNISFTVASAGTTRCEFVSSDVTRVKDEVATGASTTAADGFKRDISGVTYAFNWKLLGNGATLANCYQFIQHQLRQTTDIDYGVGSSRGDVTDLLLAFASPTGTTTNLYIDNINADDTNNVTYKDATGQSRLEPFVSSLTISHNTNLQGDAFAKVKVMFTNDDAGDNTGRDFGTSTAITVKDSAGADMSYNVSGLTEKQFTYDYDGNVQRGGASAGTDAPITIVGIGLATAQYVIITGTITRAKGLTFSLVSPLERNYSNP